MELFSSVWLYILEAAVLLSLGWLFRWLKQKADRQIQTAAKTWPYVHGHVEHADAKMIGDGKAAFWVGELAYSYSVNGDYFAGLHHLPASNEDAAYDAVRGWKDRKVIIHYSPENHPSLS